MASNLITTGELLLYPTGLDWATLAERILNVDQGPDSSAQAIEQAGIIKLASEWVANHCEMPRGLHATTQTETVRVVRTGLFGARAWVDREGWLNFKAANLPILNVDSVSYGIAPGPITYIDMPDASLFVSGTYPQMFRVSENSRDWTWAKSGGVTVRVKYTAGYPNAVLKSSVSSGSNKQLTIDSTLGFAIANSQNSETIDYQKVINIYDGVNSELAVPIVSVDDATHLTVSSLAHDHDPTTDPGKTMGIGVSSLPESIKTATILACVHFAKARGATALVMKTMGSIAQKASTEIISLAEYELEPWVHKM